MSFDFDNNKPIYIQIIDRLKLKIVSGELVLGSKLDSVRVMAEKYEVNPNTMQKALSNLENEGLVHSFRTKGRFVTEDKEKLNFLKKEIARFEINKLKNILLKLGYNEEEILELIKKIIRKDI